MSDQNDENTSQKNTIQRVKANFIKTNRLMNLANPIGIPPAVQTMYDNLKWIQDLAYPPHFRSMLAMKKQLTEMHRMMTSPVVEVLSQVRTVMQPYMQLQESLAYLNSSMASRLAESMKGITAHLPPSFFQNSIPDYSSFLPDLDISFPKNVLKNLENEEDKDYGIMVGIMEGVKEQKSTYPDAIQQLLSIATESLSEQQESNRHQQESSWQGKVSLIITFITFLLAVYTALKPENENNNSIGEETFEAVEQLKQMLTQETKATTANLNLRFEPDTTTSKNILLTIPKGEEITIIRSINHWCQIWYTDPETGVVHSGWVSKRYLK